MATFEEIVEEPEMNRLRLFCLCLAYERNSLGSLIMPLIADVRPWFYSAASRAKRKADSISLNYLLFARPRGLQVLQWFSR